MSFSSVSFRREASEISSSSLARESCFLFTLSSRVWSLCCFSSKPSLKLSAFAEADARSIRADSYCRFNSVFSSAADSLSISNCSLSSSALIFWDSSEVISADKRSISFSKRSTLASETAKFSRKFLLCSCLISAFDFED